MMRKFRGFEKEVSPMNGLGELNPRTFVGLGFMIQRDIKMYEDRLVDRRTAPITDPYIAPQEVIDKKGPIIQVPISAPIDEPPLLPEEGALVSIPYEYDPDAVIYDEGDWYTEVLTQEQIDERFPTQPDVTGSTEADSMGPLDVTSTEGQAVVTPRSMRPGAAGTPLIIGAARNGVIATGDIIGAPTTTAQNNAGLLIAAAVAMLVLGG